MRTFVKWTVWGASLAAAAIVVIIIGSRLPPVKKAVAQGVPTVSAKDLTAAGFSGVAVQLPSGARFQGPVSYFRVTESSNDAGWKSDGVANVVAVGIFSTVWEAAAVTDGNVATDVSGRSSVCASRVGAYICVIGPDAKKGEALADILKAK